MVLASAAVIVALANPAQSNQLGTVNFPTSCSSAVQPTIERAVALLHSFQYEEAAQAFDDAARPIGEVDFFGYKGLDVDRVRAILPFHEGDLFPPEHSSSDALKTQVRDAVANVIGQGATDAVSVCCDRKGHWMIYIGLPGASSRTVRYNPAPTQDVVLPPEIFRMNEEVEKTLTAAVMRGNTGEDDSRGYALSLDPDARARQLAVRGYALRHEPILLHVLEESSNAPHRAVAAEALGYARVSKRQISALVGACLDPDDTVRNNAVRALGVLARAKQAVARAMPADMFIQLLGSGRWTDHNKAVLVLEALSTRRDPALLKQLRQQAVDSLLEMARWRNPDHAQAALAILGRIAGIEEKRLEELIEQQKPDEIVNAVNRLGTAARD